MCLSRWYIGGVSVSYVLIFMSATSENNKRIAKNTLFLYMRMLLIMGVTLYTSRVVLQVLGVEDFGIYNVVGGIVALLGFISSSMSISIQRFLSYEMGRKNYEKVSRAFSMALQIHGIIAVVVMMLLETAGIYFLRCKMVIPIDRMDSALSVFHCSVLACGFSIVQVPFIALIIAYERMGLYAYIGIVDTMLKLAIAFLLGWIAYDSLALYGGLMLVATIVITLAYVMVCHLSFKEIRYQCIWDTRLFGSLTRFASWSALGEMAWGFTLQGVNIVLNLFFGTVVNAAYGISSQVSAAVYRFLGSFQTAVNPQLIKEYAQGNVMGMMGLAYRGMKFSFFLLLFIAYPLVLEMDFILSRWLGTVPELAPAFCRLVVANALLDILSSLFATLAKAYGKIRNYQIVVSLTLFLNFPLSYVALKVGYPPFMIFVVYSIVSMLLVIIRCRLIAGMFEINVLSAYSKQVLIPVLRVLFISSLLPLAVNSGMEEGWLRLFAMTACSIVSVAFAVYVLGLTSGERAFVENRIINIKERLVKNG